MYIYSFNVHSHFGNKLHMVYKLKINKIFGLQAHWVFVYYIHQFLLLSLFIISGCQLDEIEIQDWSPEFVTPLINARITIADLIPERHWVKTISCKL